MDLKTETWLLVLDHDSMLSRTWGAYGLNTIMKSKEMNVLVKLRRF